MNSHPVEPRLNEAPWRDVVARYSTPDFRRSIWMLTNSMVPYILIWVAMWFSLRISYWLTLALSVIAAGFLIRCFIILHDCTHGSFFKSRKANDFWGVVMGILTYTPYYRWRHEHAVHHAAVGNLDRRGWPDVWMLTVKEYLALSPFRQLIYRVFRHPFSLFIIGPFYLFMINHRLLRKGGSAREHQNVIFTNIALLALHTILCLLMGVKAYLMIHLPIFTLSTGAALWLFYVQHIFEPPYWKRHDEWDYNTAALLGSSYYKLPKILQWFTGNIGIHHVHHLCPRVPNYYLQNCQDETPTFQEIEPLTIRKSLKSLWLRVWDEDLQKMLSFKEMRSLYGSQSNQIR